MIGDTDRRNTPLRVPIWSLWCHSE